MESEKSKIPQWAKGFILKKGGTGIVEYRNKQYEYVVLKRGMIPGLLNFVGFVESSNFLYISEDVPVKYRKYVLRHELRKCLGYGGSGKEKCRRSLEAELKEVPDALKRRYIWWRFRSFNNLFWYYSEGPGRVAYNEKCLYEILGSLLFLESALNA